MAGGGGRVAGSATATVPRPVTAPPRAGGGAAEAAELTGAARRVAERRSTRSTGASRWSARTATTWSSISGRLPAKGYASHGESWSLALALRLASFELLRADGEDPVLVLDDVFATLDPIGGRPGGGGPSAGADADHRGRTGRRAGRAARRPGQSPATGRSLV